MQGEVVICSTCREGVADALDDALARLGLRLVRHACLNLCEAPVALALQGPGRATMLFAGVDPEADAADIVATCNAWLAAERGWIKDARSCGRLRLCLKARVPATAG